MSDRASKDAADISIASSLRQDKSNNLQEQLQQNRRQASKMLPVGGSKGSSGVNCLVRNSMSGNAPEEAAVMRAVVDKEAERSIWGFVLGRLARRRLNTLRGELESAEESVEFLLCCCSSRKTCSVNANHDLDEVFNCKPALLHIYKAWCTSVHKPFES